MKAIVTGGLGFVGRNLCEALLSSKEEWKVLVIDDVSSGKSWNKVDDIEYIYRSIQKEMYPDKTTMDVFVEEFQPNVIFHLAAIPRVSFSVENPIATTEANVGGTLAVLEAVRKCSPQTKVINTSSSSVYGGADVMPTPPDHPTDPKSPYALQKWQAEEWCRMYSKLYDLNTVSLRYFNVTGPHSYFGGAYSTVLSAWLHHLYIDPEYKPFLEGDGTQTRDFCAIENVCQANILAASHDDKFRGDAFNVAQASSHSLLDCKAILEKISGKSLNLERRPERVGDVKHTLADISLTKSILGYDPVVNFESQVERMATWYENKYRTS